MTDLANFVPIGPRIVTDGALRHLDQTVLTVWNDKTKSADKRDGPTPDYEVDVTDTEAVRDMALARAAAKRAAEAAKPPKVRPSRQPAPERGRGG